MAINLDEELSNSDGKFRRSEDFEWERNAMDKMNLNSRVPISVKDMFVRSYSPASLTNEHIISLISKTP